MQSHLLYHRLNYQFASLFVLTTLAVPFAWAGDSDQNDEDSGRVILTFSTVGDSRQDPVTADPTTLRFPGRTQFGCRTPKPSLGSSVPLRASNRGFSSSMAT